MRFVVITICMRICEYHNYKLKINKVNIMLKKIKFQIKKAKKIHHITYIVGKKIKVD